MKKILIFILFALAFNAYACLPSFRCVSCEMNGVKSKICVPSGTEDYFACGNTLLYGKC